MTISDLLPVQIFPVSGHRTGEANPNRRSRPALTDQPRHCLQLDLL